MSVDSQIRAERRRADRDIARLNKTHQILDDETLTAEEKYVMLVSEQGFGKIRAQQLAFGRQK